METQIKKSRLKALKGYYQKPETMLLNCIENIEGECSDMASMMSAGVGCCNNNC